MVTNSNLTRFGVTTKWNYTFTSRNYARDLFKHEHVRRYLLRVLKLYEYDSDLLFSHFSLNQSRNPFIRLFLYDNLIYTKFFHDRRTHKKRILKTFSLERFTRYKLRTKLFRVVKLVSYLILIRHRLFMPKYPFNISQGNIKFRRQQVRTIGLQLRKIYINKFIYNLFKFNNIKKFSLFKGKIKADRKLNKKKSLKKIILLRRNNINKSYKLRRFLGPKQFFFKISNYLNYIPTTLIVRKNINKEFLLINSQFFVNFTKPIFYKKLLVFYKKHYRFNFYLVHIIIKYLNFKLIKKFKYSSLFKKAQFALILKLLKFVNVLNFFIVKTTLIKKNNAQLYYFKKYIYFKFFQILTSHVETFVIYSKKMPFSYLRLKKLCVKLFSLMLLKRKKNKSTSKTLLKTRSLQLRQYRLIDNNLFIKNFVEKLSKSRTTRNFKKDYSNRQKKYLKLSRGNTSSKINNKKQLNFKPMKIVNKTVKFSNKGKRFFTTFKNNLNEKNKYFVAKYTKKLFKNVYLKKKEKIFSSVLKIPRLKQRIHKKNKIGSLSLKQLRAKYSKSIFFSINRFILKYSIYKLHRDLPIINQDFLNYDIFINPLKINKITHFLYARFITRRLIQRFSLFETLKVLRKFLSLPTLRGYLIKCSGRFTKKQRASTYVFRKGSIPIGTFNARLNYHTETVRLKYGACCIKIWINR